jgi:hypothetical protein
MNDLHREQLTQRQANFYASGQTVFYGVFIRSSVNSLKLMGILV